MSFRVLCLGVQCLGVLSSPVDGMPEHSSLRKGEATSSDDWVVGVSGPCNTMCETMGERLYAIPVAGWGQGGGCQSR